MLRKKRRAKILLRLELKKPLSISLADHYE